MTVITVERTLYTFDDLPTEKAKRAALEWGRDVYFKGEWWDSVYDDFQQIAKIIGIDIYDDGRRSAIFFQKLFCQGQGASFRGFYSYAKGCRAGIRAHAPIDTRLHAIVDRLADVQRSAFYRLYANVEPIRDTTIHCEVYEARPEQADEVTGALRDLCDWLARQLADECLALGEDDHIGEWLTINEFTFDETGDRQDP